MFPADAEYSLTIYQLPINYVCRIRHAERQRSLSLTTNTAPSDLNKHQEIFRQALETISFVRYTKDETRVAKPACRNFHHCVRTITREQRCSRKQQQDIPTHLTETDSIPSSPSNNELFGPRACTPLL